jgi:hypothetical protein
MTKTPTTTPEEDYLAAAVAFHEARERYDHKTSNKVHDKLDSAARKIRLHSADGGEAFFASLLNHPKPYVSLCAAFNLIPFNPKLARKTYERLAKGAAGEVGVAAEMTLKEWKAGRLDPDYFMKE